MSGWQSAQRVTRFSWESSPSGLQRHVTHLQSRKSSRREQRFHRPEHRHTFICPVAFTSRHGSRVSPSVARRTQGNEILLGICTGLAPPLYVMNLNASHRPTQLAAPAVSFENFPAKILVFLSIELDSANLERNLTHAASVTCCRNSCCCARGRKRKSRSMENSRILGLPFSIWAPARKSAQIISRQ